VYLSWQDYNAGKLTPENGQCKIKKHKTFNKKYIYVIVDGKNTRYNKDSIFGYKDEHFTYRYYNKEEYLIKEKGEIMIYVFYELESGPKNYVFKPHFYFSKDAASSIAPLSVINIKRAFPDNFTLHHYLDIEFYGKDIAAYDNENNTYKINNLLKRLNQKDTTKN
jgi:hypothetical protein